MTTSSIFIKDGKYYILQKDPFEITEKFNERGWFVVNANPKTKEEYDMAVKFSRIMINKKYNGAIYSTEIEEVYKKYI